MFDINIIMEDMGVPLSRRDLNKLGNIEWCIRNFPISFRDHPAYNQMMVWLKEMKQNNAS